MHAAFSLTEEDVSELLLMYVQLLDEELQRFIDMACRLSNRGAAEEFLKLLAHGSAEH